MTDKQQVRQVREIKNRKKNESQEGGHERKEKN